MEEIKKDINIQPNKHKDNLGIMIIILVVFVMIALDVFVRDITLNGDVVSHQTIKCDLKKEFTTIDNKFEIIDNIDDYYKLLDTYCDSEYGYDFYSQSGNRKEYDESDLIDKNLLVIYSNKYAYKKAINDIREDGNSVKIKIPDYSGVQPYSSLYIIPVSKDIEKVFLECEENDKLFTYRDYMCYGFMVCIIWLFIDTIRIAVLKEDELWKKRVLMNILKILILVRIILDLKIGITKE